MPRKSDEKTLKMAEHVAEVLRRHGLGVAVIGAMALAAHGYARATDDFDLATDGDPFSQLEQVTAALRAEGWRVELLTPDAADPLGGVINLRGKRFKMIQVVSFNNPLNGQAPVGREAIQTALPLAGTSLGVVDLPHLIGLKLYAGGTKSKADVIELLERNRTADMAAVRDVCERFGLSKDLEPLLEEIGLG